MILGYVEKNVDYHNSWNFDTEGIFEVPPVVTKWIRDDTYYFLHLYSVLFQESDISHRISTGTFF